MVNLTLYGLYIVINLRNKDQRDALSSTLIVLAASQRGCMINATDCMYSKLPAEDEQLIYSKHVEDITEINLKRKCISLVLITQNKLYLEYSTSFGSVLLIYFVIVLKISIHAFKM